MNNINWTQLASKQQLEELIQNSETTAQLIFKFSDRCGLSHSVLHSLEGEWKANETSHIEPYFLDIFSARILSNEIETRFGIRHQSPQVLIIKNGDCIYDNSHSQINYHQIKERSKLDVSSLT